MESELLTFTEARRFLNVKESWLRSAIFKEEIPVVKLGRLIRFRKTDLFNYIQCNIRGEIDISIPEIESEGE